MLAEQKSTEGLNTGAATGKKDGPRGSYTVPRDERPTLSSLGIDNKLSSRAQKIAA